MSDRGGYGVRLVRNGTPIAQVRDISGPAMKRDTIDVTTRDDGGKDQFLGGLREGGEVSFDVVYDPGLAGHKLFTAAIEGGAIDLMELHLTDDDGSRQEGMRFAARATKFEPKSPLRDALTADVTYQLSSAPTPIIYLVDHAGNYLVATGLYYLIA